MIAPQTLRLGSSQFHWGRRTYIMGIINATPDSFSGDGIGSNAGAALRLAEQQVADGADIVDVGGESTRPGSSPVSADEELRRVVPVIAALSRHLEVPISVDTSKAIVAQAALDSGAVMVNDVSGLRQDPELATTIAAAGAAAAIMENGRGASYADLMLDVVSRLEESVAIASRAGVKRERLIIDPGFGFGKTVKQNLEIVRRLAALRELGLPVLIGPSRKSTIGRVLNVPVEERLEGTASLVALSIAQGADIVRVHDVRAMVRVARMADAVMRPAKYGPAGGLRTHHASAAVLLAPKPEPSR